VVARRDDVGARTWRPTIRGRERYARHRWRTAPARARARGLLTIFSRFFAFMFSARRFATRSGRTARCAFPPTLGDANINDRLPFHRPSLYGLLVRARRLFGCWDSAGQLMSSRYADRVTISDLIYLYLENWTIASFIFIFSFIFTHLIPHPSSPIQALSRIYPTNIIAVIPVVFSHIRVTRSYFPNCLSRHATIYYHAVFPFCFTIWP
jgi:hypothetical protein